MWTLQWSGESRIPIRWICTGWVPSSLADKLNITDFLKASITTDSIKIFSITFCILVTVYCTCKKAKDAFRIVLYGITFYMQHCTVARFVLKQHFVCNWDVQCCMLLKDSVFVLWINNFECSLKSSVSLVLATEHLKLEVESWKWRHHSDLLYMDTSLIRTLRSVPSVSVLERFDCT